MSDGVKLRSVRDLGGVVAVVVLEEAEANREGCFDASDQATSVLRHRREACAAVAWSLPRGRWRLGGRWGKEDKGDRAAGRFRTPLQISGVRWLQTTAGRQLAKLPGQLLSRRGS